MSISNDNMRIKKAWPQQQQQQHHRYHTILGSALLWYVAFGAIHEMGHVLAAHLMTMSMTTMTTTYLPFNLFEVRFWYELLISRQVSMDFSRMIMTADDDDDNSNVVVVERIIAGIHHAGWILSLFLALVVTGIHRYHVRCCRRRDSSIGKIMGTSTTTATMLSSMEVAAWLTALEAIATDLVGISASLSRILPTSNYCTTTIGMDEENDNHNKIHAIFWCGNFGILLLHHMWFQDRVGRESALDCLEQMVQITMMRGAQSGGVVTYQPTGGAGGGNNLKGTRCRVVNKKRTDLSKELRKRISISRNLPSDFSPFLAGHTRFATSSKATLDGTHPHQWTPPTTQHVFDFSTITASTTRTTTTTTNTKTKLQSGFSHRTIENFITHNGDLEFYQLNGKTYETDTILQWLGKVLRIPAPASVDSMAIAGMIDVIRCRGCFALAARYAVAMGMASSNMDVATSGDNSSSSTFPSRQDWETIGAVFEECWKAELVSSASAAHNNNKRSHSVDEVNEEDASSTILWTDSVTMRVRLTGTVAGALRTQPDSVLQPLKECGILVEEQVDEEASPSSLYAFCMATIHAFLDNDLFYTAQIFLKHAKGSFGLMVSSSWDAHRQVVVAARGQTMSIGFYPDKGLICYGSEQAAVKAGLNAQFPGKKEFSSDIGSKNEANHHEGHDVDMDATRLDLDDLGGEIVLLDWGKKNNKADSSGSTNHASITSRVVSKPSRHLAIYSVMRDTVQLVIYQESKSSSLDRELYHRLTRLTRNDLIKPLPQLTDDPILQDLNDIPKVCRAIQDDFQSSKATSGMNRLTAFHLSTCLKSRLEKRIQGRVPAQSVDVLLTGCEVSLWLAEQFASDLQKCFPKLVVQAMSSNKILGMNGQEISIPALGFPYSTQTNNFHDTIVLIVSHSGGTFAPLACSNLLQSATKNIFVVAGDWDTQIGKNLRLMNKLNDGGEHLLNHRIFSTNIGIRPAEPCSLSVVATHQLLTNLLQYLSVVILSDARYRRVTGAAISAMDIQILERCNHMNIDALTEIVGVNLMGYTLDRQSNVLRSLRKAGDLWAEHILENVRAYMMGFVYIFTTVISGYPLASAIAWGAGLSRDSSMIYIVKVIDAAIYFWLPQICIMLLRLWQGRNILHRMVCRTVVIGDIPWVAQSAEAFLSKIFAVSYSIAGLNVLSGNPSDHLVHRHTHRVVRGTLAIVGRPDGRLSALSTAESSVCLSVNQASSIQSWGGTCESITIGHNPFKLDLSLNGIFLKRNRPLFLCERLLVESDAKHEENTQKGSSKPVSGDERTEWRNGLLKRISSIWKPKKSSGPVNLNASVYKVADCSISLKINRRRSAPALLGAYLDIDDKRNSTTSSSQEANPVESPDGNLSVEQTVREAIRSRKHDDRLHQLFSSMDKDGDGVLSESEFFHGLRSIDTEFTVTEAKILFSQTDTDGSGRVSFEEFSRFVQENDFEVSILKIPPSHRDSRGIIQIEPTKEKYFGEKVRKFNSGKRDKQEVDFELARRQHMAQELYETRIASMQRFVSMTIMFYQMGKRVEEFFSFISFGFWSYRMDRTHSIMRIATTASPVSGADVRHRMEHLRLLKKVQHSVEVISNAYLAYKKKQKLTSAK